MQKCIQDKFRKETNFLENLNEQVKKKESLKLSGGSNVSQNKQLNGSNPFRGKKKVYWIVLTVCIVTVLVTLGVTLYRRWRRHQALMLLLQGCNYFNKTKPSVLY